MTSPDPNAKRDAASSGADKGAHRGSERGKPRKPRRPRRGAGAGGGAAGGNSADGGRARPRRDGQEKRTPRTGDGSAKGTGHSRDRQESHKQRPRRKRRPQHHRAAVFKPFTPEQLARRAAAIPVIRYPDLPVSDRRDDIAAAIRDNQVVIVSGETGSGKTTQLPKICLQLGRGVNGMIGHTQPRRIAARSVAERIADELGQKVGPEDGKVIGYQVRFTDEVGPTTLVKLMTDGILLAEIQSDPLLRRYDTLIIDEAHERSLNIDFILGYLARLLPLRPDLKVIITSATIDSERFAEHFGQWEGTPGKGRLIKPAPALEVSGRTYPVEIRYRPLSQELPTAWTSESGAEPDEIDDAHEDRVQQLVLEDPDDDLPTLGYGLGEDIDQETAICEAVDELVLEGPGDILVFLPGERDIRDTQAALEDHLKDRGPANQIEIIPLFARLSAAEQHRVFEPHSKRRVVLATNVAETSLTVPGVRFVIDPGLARVSRFSNKTKVQRLPIEPVSQASANQRAGRSGRVADGVAIRLYSQQDYEHRAEFTEPEILRTSLASVILQMAALGLGAVGDFPFLDPPDPRAVRDGVQLLTEIGALEPDTHGLTAIGRDLASLPIDPRLARMLIEGDANGCASEVLVIVAALSIQDVRERPLDHQQAADEAHRRFTDPKSDFVTYLNLWRYLNVQSRDLSGSQFRKMCRAEFLHYLRFREWRDIVNQLRQMARPLDLDIHNIGEPSPGQVARAATQGGIANAAARAVVAYTASTSAVDADQIHRSLLVGLLSNLGSWDIAKKDYTGARGTRFVLWPGSGLSGHPDWVMTAELVETSRLFARTVAAIDIDWVEPVAGHLVKRNYSEPYWSSGKGAAMVKERVTLYGMTLAADRPVLLGRLDVTFGDTATPGRPIAVPKAGTLAGLAQGLVGRGAEHATQGSTALADALSEALNLTQPKPEVEEDRDAAASSSIKEKSAPEAITARELAREMFIRHALVLGEWRSHHHFVKRNRDLLDEAHDVERRSRTMGLVAGEEQLVQFFDERIPDDIVSARHFDNWWKRQRRETPELLDYTMDLLLPQGAGTDPDQFPDTWVQGEHRFPLEYAFTPGSAADGVTMSIPVEVLPRVVDTGTDWLVPGMTEELVTGWIRALPKAKRRQLAPAPEVAARVVSWMGGDRTGVTILDSIDEDAAPGEADPRSLDAALDRLAAFTGQKRGDKGTAAPADAPARQPANAPTNAPSMPSADPTGHQRHANESSQDDSARLRSPREDDEGTEGTQTEKRETVPEDLLALDAADRPPFREAFARAVRELRGVDLDDGELDYAEGQLPDHLRMRFRIVDQRGRQVEAGPSLAYLQKQLAQTADKAVRSAVRGAVAEAMKDSKRRGKKALAADGGETSGGASGAADAAGAAGTRGTSDMPAKLHVDGLTEFPAEALPRTVDSRGAGGMTLRGYPALVAQGSSEDPLAGVRVMASPADADRQHRLGLARLVCRRVRLATGRITTRWTGREALMLAATPYATTQALVADAQLSVSLALVDELSGPGGAASVRDAEAFDELCGVVRDQLEDRVYDQLHDVIRAMDAHAEVQAALTEHPGASLEYVRREVKRQTKELLYPGFLMDTPATAMPHLARYLRAGARRLARADRDAKSLARDERDAETVRTVVDAVEHQTEVAAGQPYDPVRAATLEQARWMIWELRVSLFAQELGTPMKVSAKRILGMVEP